MHHTYLQAIKSFEGFAAQAQWDYAQHSNGFGTKALYPGEAISPEEAERRFAAEIAVARNIVEKHAAGWDEGTKAALTSLTFNAGTRWLSSGLGDAVRSQDIEAVKERFVQYSKAGGEVLPGLLRRRLAEVDWIGRGPEGAAAGPSMAARANGPSPTDRASETTATASLDALLRTSTASEGNPTSPSSDDSDDPHAAQALSMLMTLLFDLQMRSALADPLKQSETPADRLERVT